VFASFTALSFVDIKELTTDDVVEINGEKWILSKRHKTKVNFQVKLLDIPLQIIKLYERFQENNLVFPNLNYWNICKPLKKMIKECGISKDISFHTLIGQPSKNGYDCCHCFSHPLIRCREDTGRGIKENMRTKRESMLSLFTRKFTVRYVIV